MSTITTTTTTMMMSIELDDEEPSPATVGAGVGTAVAVTPGGAVTLVPLTAARRLPVAIRSDRKVAAFVTMAVFSVAAPTVALAEDTVAIVKVTLTSRRAWTATVTSAAVHCAAPFVPQIDKYPATTFLKEACAAASNWEAVIPARITEETTEYGTGVGATDGTGVSATDGTGVEATDGTGVGTVGVETGVGAAPYTDAHAGDVVWQNC